MSIGQHQPKGQAHVRRTRNSPQKNSNLPLLPLRDVVVFPHMVIPLFVGRPKSIKALETAMEAGKSILLVAQKSAAKDEPEPEDLYAIGCVANILQMLKLPDGTVKVLVEGTQRARVDCVSRTSARCSSPAVTPIPLDDAGKSRSRSHAARDSGPVRPVREAEQEDSAGDPDFAGGHRGGRSPGRHHRRASADEARAEAGNPRDCSMSASAWKSCCRNWKPNSTSSRSRSASAAASSARWKRASASTT